MRPEVSLNSEERLCLACGMCCDGTLFDRVPLAEEETARLKGTALTVISTQDGRPALRQRCSALEGGCAVYHERPHACRTYRCLLLDALAQGEVDLADALQIVATTREAPSPARLAMYFGRRR